MKKKIITAVLLVMGFLSYSQDMKKFNLYKPEENAGTEIDKTIAKAKAENKHVFIQVGGNWCIWCARFYEFVGSDRQLDSLMNADYVVYHLNYSKENYNAKLLEKYSYPQRFGFPVFLVLDGDGRLLHTQNSWYLEDGEKSYDREKIKSFFTDWGKKALDPAQYKEQ